MGLSDKAVQVCKDNYKKNCGRCPIRTACITPIGPGKEASERWIDNVNAAAQNLAP